MLEIKAIHSVSLYVVTMEILHLYYQSQLGYKPRSTETFSQQQTQDK